MIRPRISAELETGELIREQVCAGLSGSEM
jgi:hypothetical protein